jgi:hypothetical protein
MKTAPARRTVSSPNVIVVGASMPVHHFTTFASAAEYCVIVGPIVWPRAEVPAQDVVAVPSAGRRFYVVNHSFLAANFVRWLAAELAPNLFHDSVLVKASRHCRRLTEPEDLCQDAWVQALEHATSFHGHSEAQFVTGSTQSSTRRWPACCERPRRRFAVA